jgi:hypothetical protein
MFISHVARCILATSKSDSKSKLPGSLNVHLHEAELQHLESIINMPC